MPNKIYFCKIKLYEKNKPITFFARNSPRYIRYIVIQGASSIKR